jgi:hypothetical protein
LHTFIDTNSNSSSNSSSNTLQVREKVQTTQPLAAVVDSGGRQPREVIFELIKSRATQNSSFPVNREQSEVFRVASFQIDLHKLSKLGRFFQQKNSVL